MQINSNFNRANIPQFGMALKINKGAEEYLQGKSMEFLNRLEQTGRDMADFKYYDLVLSKDGFSVKHKTLPSEYKNPAVTAPNPHNFSSLTDLKVDTTYVPSNKEKFTLFFELGDNAEACKAYDAISGARDDLVRNSILTKLLEERAANQAAKEAEEAVKQAEKDNFINNLFSKFGSKD